MREHRLAIKRPSYRHPVQAANQVPVDPGFYRMGVTAGMQGAVSTYDLVGDPGETKDFAATRPIERRMLTDNLGMFLALRTQWKKATWGVVSNVTALGATALDEATTP